VREVVTASEGDPVMGAVAGALIGGFLFRDRGPGTLIGAAAGAAIGAAASQDGATTRTYQVLVRFDDGTRGLFLYRDYTSFTPGLRVELTSQGLRPSP
jgi:outer membrane lipoprotein SlyB